MSLDEIQAAADLAHYNQHVGGMHMRTAKSALERGFDDAAERGHPDPAFDAYLARYVARRRQQGESAGLVIKHAYARGYLAGRTYAQQCADRRAASVARRARA